MTSAPPPLALWFAFAGRALLSADADQLRDLLSELTEAPAPGEDFEKLAAALADSLPANNTTLESEYVRLFFNPQGSPCMIWQSAHDLSVRLMGASHQSALAWYRSAGIEPLAENQPADHAGLLLSFYARLLEHHVPSEERARFHREHLDWLSKLCDELDQNARLAFFQNLSHLIRLLVEVETPAAT